MVLFVLFSKRLLEMASNSIVQIKKVRLRGVATVMVLISLGSKPGAVSDS